MLKHFFHQRLIFIILYCLSLCLHAAAQEFEEYELKAVYLFRYAQFIELPAQVFVDANQPLHICVLGENPFKTALDQITQDKQVSGRNVLTMYLQKVEDTIICHILYISGSEKARLPLILNYMKDKPIFTVSDIQYFVDSGGIVEFFNRSDKVRFIINLKIAKAVGIYISANLLRVADEVRQ